MKKLQIWLNAMRLRTLPLSLSGIFMGVAMAILYGFWDFGIFFFSISTTISFQILSNFANDLGDTLKGADNDQRIGPKRTVQSGLISKKQMKIALITMVLISLLSSLFLILVASIGMNWSLIVTFILFALLSILAAIGYTIGKNAYGYYGLGDLMVFIFFGLVSVFGSFALFSKYLFIGCIFPSITIGFLSVAVLNLNNLRDYNNDKKVGKKTLVVRIGTELAKKYQILLIFLAFIAHVFFILSSFTFNLLTTFNGCFLLLSVLPFLVLFVHLYRIYKNNDLEKIDTELKVVALSTFVCSILTLTGAFFLNF